MRPAAYLVVIRKIMKSYSDISLDFNPDGSLRDIYVFECNNSLWNMLIQSITKSDYRHEFWHGKTLEALPCEFDSIKMLQETDPTVLKIFLPKGIQVNCHFFVENEIEMDITPKEIINETGYNTLVSFLKWLASIVHRTVVLTYENSPEKVILSVEPNIV